MDYDWYDKYTRRATGDPAYHELPNCADKVTYISTSEPWIDGDVGYIRAIRADHYDGIPDGEPLLLTWVFPEDDDTGELCIDFTAEPDAVHRLHGGA